METIRGLVRPFIAVSFIAMTGWLVYEGKVEAKEILSIMGIVIGFYFMERALTKKEK